MYLVAKGAGKRSIELQSCSPAQRDFKWRMKQLATWMAGIHHAAAIFVELKLLLSVKAVLAAAVADIRNVYEAPAGSALFC